MQTCNHAKYTMQDTKTKGYKDIGQVMLETLSSNWCQINRGPRMYLTVRGRESQIAPAAASQGNTHYKIRNAKKLKGTWGETSSNMKYISKSW